MKSDYPKRISAKDFAYFETKNKIVNNELYPNEIIVEENLSEELQISRTPLREALLLLESEELVVRQANGRLKVAPISVNEVKDIFIVRQKLEGILIENAIDNITDKDIEHLTYINIIIKEAKKNNQIKEVLKYGEAFHSYIYKLGENEVATKILHQLNDQIHRYRSLVQIQPDENSLQEHELIIKFIKEKNKQAAKAALEQHISNSLTSAIKSIEAYEKVTETTESK